MKHLLRTALVCALIGALVLLAHGRAMADDKVPESSPKAGPGDTEGIVFSIPGDSLASFLFAGGENEKAKVFNMKLALTGFTQVRFTQIENDKDVVTGDEDFLDVIRMRFCAKMTADKGLTTFFQLDMGDDEVLMDAWVQYKHSDHFYVRAGQMIPPFGWEMPLSPYSLATINYGQVIGKMCPVIGAFRDQGFFIGGTAMKEKGEANGPLYWKLGFFNGSGRNLGADDSHGALFFRLGIQPVRKKDNKGDMVDFGLNYWKEKEGSGGAAYVKVRTALDFRVHMKEWIFQGEYWTNSGSDDLAAGGEPDTSGYFFELGYKIVTDAKVGEFTPYWVPMLRYDYYDEENAVYGATTVTSVGCNYHMASCAYLQVFFEIHAEENEVGGSELHNNKLLIQMNVKF